MLRYGENPQQKAAFYQHSGARWNWIDACLQGKELSFNNILDLDAALSLCAEWTDVPAVVVVKFPVDVLVRYVHTGKGFP
jgi:phosphoribosylaminoimidazolecarboxamide formyltransferase/IMP cyclohydrolase